MQKFQEIGGYLELECGKAPAFHSGALALASACAGLRLVIRSRKITRLHVPEYTCPVVWEAIKAEGCECIFYQIDDDFLPPLTFPADEWILYNNYFGIGAEKVKRVAQRYPQLIVDNAQAFYMPHCGAASIYSPHKFFGVPDGGYLISDFPVDLPEQRAESWQKCAHLLKRHDLGASAGYQDFQKIGALIRADGVSRISSLTEALLGNVDYARCRTARLKNFSYLHERLQKRNCLKITLSSDDVPMVYPLLLENEALRERLIAAKVYVARYWPGVPATRFLDILPLPVDQRYDLPEMEYMMKIIERG